MPVEATIGSNHYIRTLIDAGAKVNTTMMAALMDRPNKLMAINTSVTLLGHWSVQCGMHEGALCHLVITARQGVPAYLGWMSSYLPTYSPTCPTQV